MTMNLALRLGAGAAAGSSFTPTDLANLALWLDADDASSFTYSSGVVVSQWNDKSGNSRHFTQGTVGSQPSRSGTQNGRSTVVFDGTDDFLGRTSFMSGTVATMFAVVKVDADPPATSAKTGNWYFSDATGAAGASSFPWTNGSIDDCFGLGSAGGNRKDVGNPSTSLAQFNVYGVTVSQSVQWTAHLNGTQLFTTSTSTLVGWSASDHTIGKNPIPRYLDGEIAEFIIYTSALGTTDRQSVEAYLKAKWNTP